MRTLLLLNALTLLTLAAQDAPPPWTIYRLPDTGQTRRYATADGDDSTVTMYAPRFALSADGIATDLITGLQWQREDAGEMRWADAPAYCQSLRLGGLTGWRVPEPLELFTILNHGFSQPALDPAVFSRTSAEYWWASIARPDNPALAWAANAGGGIGAHPVSESISAGGSKRFHTRCVRTVAEGRSVPALFTENPDGTVTDNRTGLMWQKDDTTVTWEESFAYAKALRLGGYEDWRVPNIKELRSLHTDTTVRPSIATAYFPATAQAPYWSSTTQIGQNGVTAWTLDFTFGVVSYNPKTERRRLRAVRGGDGPRIAFGGIRNAASYGDGPLAAGEIVAIFGSEFGFPEGRGAVVADGALATSLGGRSVFFNGLPAPIVSWSDTQVNVIVPTLAARAATATVAFGLGPARYPAHVTSTAAASPALFTASARGNGPAAAYNQDGSLNAPTTPAARGEIVILYATGHGALNPPAPDGVLSNGPSPSPTLKPSVFIGGAEAEILYAGLVPGLPAGLLQVNTRVPLAAPAGAAVLVRLRLGDFASQEGVTLALR